MKKTIIVSLLILILIPLSVACSGKTEHKASTSPAPVITKEPTAEQQLNEMERLVFKAIKFSLSSFYNPASVRVVDLCEYKDKTWGYCIVATISATNQAGGSTSKDYLIDQYGSMRGEVEVQHGYGTTYIGGFGEEDPFKVMQVKESKINAALKEYITEQGYD